MIQSYLPPMLKIQSIHFSIIKHYIFYRQNFQHLCVIFYKLIRDIEFIWLGFLNINNIQQTHSIWFYMARVMVTFSVITNYEYLSCHLTQNHDPSLELFWHHLNIFGEPILEVKFSKSHSCISRIPKIFRLHFYFICCCFFQQNIL